VEVEMNGARRTAAIGKPITMISAGAIASRRLVAGAFVIALGVAIVIAGMPFLMGLIGGPLLTVMFSPVHRRLVRHISPSKAAAVVVFLSVVAVGLPAALIVTLVVNEAPAALTGPGTQQLIAKLAALRFGDIVVGPALADASSDIVRWLSHQLVVVAGGAARATVNLLIAFVGFYYLLLSGDAAWKRAVRFVPFSSATIQRLRERFVAVTQAMLLGVALTALAQGTVVGVAFAAVGLERPLLWGVVTGFASVLPIFGSSMVWFPGVVVLLLEHRTTNAIVLAAIGLLVASQIDNVIRPVVYRRASGLHPLLTIVGAFLGLRYFGLLGVLIGPLALAYFFELVEAFEREYLVPPVDCDPPLLDKQPGI
jgi:predicted PurR-regulated permease PerM